ncbi:hypothetical protein QBC36DRAFT_301038 [Triangularia setosa]|uniref:Uncharacterized protein n=1 Tax=Triangularia setosa TaxID=2587417 RepID=A0AAN6W784_9PEZI|nr:hypothetical protein QBC36DRAFT_301038 [Podospora setosa]
MYRNSMLVLLVGASSLTTANPAANPINAILRARQGLDDVPTSTTTTTSTSTETTDPCQSSVSSIRQSVPTPPPELVSWQNQQLKSLLTQAEARTGAITDLGAVSSGCSKRFNDAPQRTTAYEAPPTTVIGTEAWESYRSSVLSWSSSVRPVVTEIAKTCSLEHPREVGQLLLPFVGNEEECRTVLSLYYGAQPATETSTTTTASTAGAARETGYVVAAVAAAAGVAGVMRAM